MKANDNPINAIFKTSKKGITTPEINHMNKIDSFFNYIKNDKIASTLHSQIIQELTEIIKKNRYLCEYFSSYENESIYIFLINLYIKESTPPNVKSSIIDFISELRINLDINKDIYDYIFQKISEMYREEDNLSKDLLHNYLTLLDIFLSDTTSNLKPRNYFSCNGEGYFEVDLSNKHLKIGCSFTVIINFRIGFAPVASDEGLISSLVNITFSNGYQLNLELKYPVFLIVKQIQKDFIKTLPNDEWVNLIITVVKDDKNISVYIFANGENRLILFYLNKPQLTNNDSITKIRFFENFYGEVSSMSFLHQKDYGYPGVNSSDFLLVFKQYKEGLWKKKRIDSFLKLLKDYDSIGVEKVKSKTVFARKPIKVEKKFGKVEDANGKLKDNLIFIFTPINYYDNKKNIIDNAYGFLNMTYTGNIRLHRYHCFQKKLGTIGMITNLLPIAEMFVIHPGLLDDKNLEIFLKIIENSLNYNRKENMKNFTECSFFQILALFIEKYPKKVFTKRILDTFAKIGEILFKYNAEGICSIYFDLILLNEKILSKYSEDLQIELWNHLLKFCQSDRTQIEIFMNLNRICLILRFYDRNKYTEMCCDRHLSMVKDSYQGKKTIMNPPMNIKLKSLENIMNTIIIEQEPEKAFALFKLLALDLSPCLTIFLINVIKKAMNQANLKWKDNFIKVLENNKYETIISSSLIHSLPEIRLLLLNLIIEINCNLSKLSQNSRTLEKKIHNLLLPKDNFYSMGTNSNDNFNLKASLKAPMNSEHEAPKNDIGENYYTNILTKKDSGKKDINTSYKTKVSFQKKEKPIKISNFPNNQAARGGNISSNIKKFEGMSNKLPGLVKVMTTSNKPKENLSRSLIVGSQSTTNQSTKNESLANTGISSYGNKHAKKGLPSIKEMPININYNLNLKNSNGETIILDEKEYIYYIDNTYKLLLFWATIPDPKRKNDDPKNKLIENPNAIELILTMAYEINDIKFYMNCLLEIETLSNTPWNAYKLISNDKIISTLLDIAYQYYKTSDKNKEKCFSLAKNILLNIYMNSIQHSKDLRFIIPCDKIEIMFFWGDKIIFNEKSRKHKEIFYEFLSEFLFEILTAFKIKYEPYMDFNLNKSNYNSEPKKNFFLYNYLILITHLFRYAFNYKHDQNMKNEGLSFSSPSESINSQLTIYLTGMKMDPSKGNKISANWLDYPIFDDIYKRVSTIWNKIKNYDDKKDKKKDKNKGKNKYTKYEEILKKAILDKDKKNLYQKELEVLCYEESENKKDLIIPLIRIIPIGLMCIIHSSEIEADFKYWLKEFKKFVRFVIIASTNLTRTNQLDLYNKYQEKCINVIIPCLAFLKELLNTSRKCKDKIENTLDSIYLLCGLIVKHQYEYINKHKGLKNIKLTGKPSRNDLLQSAVFIIFSEMLHDNRGEPLLNSKDLESFRNERYINFAELLEHKDWKNGFLENSELRKNINNHFYLLNDYIKIVETRIKLIKNSLKEESYEKCIEDILNLLPEYEKELQKYSNNSLERNKKIKNIYKRFKKQSFTWYGYWSDRKLFFQNTNKLKLKLMNHLTKTLMKPVLVPILDVSYYLPKFSGYNPSTLFNLDKETKSSKFKLIMDIDKTLKASESNIKEIKKSLIDKNEENYLRLIYTKTNPELSESLQKIADNLDFGKEEEFAVIQKDKNSKVDRIYYLSCLVKTSHHIKGVCFIDNENLNFKVFFNQKTGNAMSGVEVGFTTNDEDYDHERHTCFGSYFIYHPKDKDLYKISIKYSDIKWIFRRRYYYQDSALEIFTTTNKTFYFNFKYAKNREEVIKEIIKKLNDPAKIIDDLKEPKDNYDNVIGFENIAVTDSKKGKKIKLSKKIDLWKEWKITNYELLMWLNIYGNRSFNDLSQYPVFPWILRNYRDVNKKQLRDLSLPMGMMNLGDKSEQRKELFILNYETLKENAKDCSEESMKPFYYGSNYSNPFYVCYYLMRIFPFTHIAIELQGSRFDQPDRLFISVEISFLNSVTEKTDVRELVPEFFYLPEIFLNINNLNMGKLENGQTVNNILTPCNNDPYEFVLTMKTILESNEVSYNIQNWIDLIFGSKARGKEADNAFNVFTEASYQESVDINKSENKEALMRMVDLGLIPTQIMNKDCPKKDKKEEIIKGKEITDSTAHLICYDCKLVKDQNMFNDTVVLFGGEFSQDKITLVLNNDTIVEIKISYSIFEKKFTYEVINTINLNKEYNYNKICNIYCNGTYKKVFHFFNKGKCLIMGGFYDGKIVIYSLEGKTSYEKIPFNDDCPILSLCLDQDEEYLFVGNSQGNVAVYKITLDINKWEKINCLYDHKKEISHIHCNSDLSLWVSTSINGYINLYTLPLCKLARTFKINSPKCCYAFLSSSPLPSIVVISEETGSKIIVYSINGKMIKKPNLLNFKLKNPIIIKDLNSNEYLCYIGLKTITIHSLPNLEPKVNVDINSGIYTIFTSEDKRSLYCLNKNGSQVCIIKDEIKKALRSPSTIVM